MKKNTGIFLKAAALLTLVYGLVRVAEKKRKAEKNFSDSVNEVFAHSKIPVRGDRNPDGVPVKILIVGTGSYIGTHVEQYLSEHGDYIVQTLNTVNFEPNPDCFKGFDAVLFVAGIAHRRETRKNAHLYYEINRDLTVKSAKAAKEALVPHFIMFSSMSVYGMDIGYITKDTKTAPKNNYGKSKLAADKAIWKMRDQKFRVAILRPPMVYGNGCKGNYQPLRKLALMIPVFPSTNNKRSMIYIGNLCSFVKGVIDGQREGIFFPQNAEYVNTGELVREIASINGKRIKETKILNPFIQAVPIRSMKKVFGSLTYEKTDIVNTYSFKESIKRTEADQISGHQFNLWIFHHYATTPDRNGYIRPFRFAKHLEKRGIKTTVFASSYHHWADINVIVNDFDCKLEVSDGVTFVFVKTPSSASGSAARIKNMAAFGRGVEKIARKAEGWIGKPDVIIASSPHPLALVAGIRVARKCSIPCICEIRDLWPEAIFASGRLRESSLLGKALIAGEHWIYKNANALIFTKEGDTDYLYEKHWMTSQGGDINPSKCFYINNGVDISLYDNQVKTEILDDLDLKDDSFKVIYAGAIRPVNNVENIIQAAKFLPKDSGIKILIYGDGNLREILEKKVINENVSNVIFKGYAEQKYIPYILSKSFVNLLNYSCKEYNWSRGSSSNKLFEYLASGKPIISTVKTGYSIIEKYDCGLEMQEGSPKELAKCIMTVKNMEKARYDELCANARKAACDFDYSKLSERLLGVIRWVKK